MEIGSIRIAFTPTAPGRVEVMLSAVAPHAQALTKVVPGQSAIMIRQGLGSASGMGIGEELWIDEEVSDQGQSQHQATAQRNPAGPACEEPGESRPKRLGFGIRILHAWTTTCRGLRRQIGVAAYFSLPP